MLYKVTPMLPVPEAKPRKTKSETAPRKRRATAVFDGEGHEVLITLMCLKCKTVKPLAQFGLRKMADGAIRNQPWCRPCRSGAGTKPRKGEGVPVATSPKASTPAAEALSSSVSSTRPQSQAPSLPAVHEPLATLVSAAPPRPAREWGNDRTEIARDVAEFLPTEMHEVGPLDADDGDDDSDSEESGNIDPRTEPVTVPELQPHASNV